MSKETAVQPAKDEVNTSEVAVPVVEKIAPVAVETVSAEPKLAKKAVAAKPAPTPKIPAKPVKKAPAAAKEEVAEAPKAEKAEKVTKEKKQAPKLIRDSFTIPESDYTLFATLKQRALTTGVEVKKSEILRAAVVALAKLDDIEFAKAIGLVERIKTGRPKK